jgi:hypothetical protein
MRFVVPLLAAENLVDHQISSQALLGFERNITHLDGHQVHILRKSVTQPGELEWSMVRRFRRLNQRAQDL